MRFSDLSFSPTPEISWNKHSGEIPNLRASFLNYHKTLRIRDVSEADAGEYRCTATNRHGTVHHTIRVTVKGKNNCSFSYMTLNSESYIPSLSIFIWTCFYPSFSILDQCSQKSGPGSSGDGRDHLPGGGSPQTHHQLVHERSPDREWDIVSPSESLQDI